MQKIGRVRGTRRWVRRNLVAGAAHADAQWTNLVAATHTQIVKGEIWLRARHTQMLNGEI